jgi:hypothetical protein
MMEHQMSMHETSLHVGLRTLQALLQLLLWDTPETSVMNLGDSGNANERNLMEWRMKNLGVSMLN